MNHKTSARQRTVAAAIVLTARSRCVDETNGPEPKRLLFSASSGEAESQTSCDQTDDTPAGRYTLLLLPVDCACAPLPSCWPNRGQRQAAPGGLPANRAGQPPTPGPAARLL